MEEILRMKDNLLLIRRAVGWTAEEFGDQIGVTRQTINNIENGRNNLTKTQYIAMRSVLDAETARCPKETEMLRTILDVFVDHPENYKKEDRDELLAKANLLTPSILAGTATRKDVSTEWMKAADAAGIAVAAGMAITAAAAGVFGGILNAWLFKAAVSSKKKDKKKEDK